MRGVRLAPLLLLGACSGAPDDAAGGAALRIVTTSPLPAATVGVDYVFALEATAGDGTYWWSIVEGTLPGGLDLDGGTIRGAPYEEGAVSITVRVEDGRGDSASRALRLMVTPEDGALAIVTRSLPAAATHTEYEANLTASGGDGVYSWWIEAGTFPDGLSITAAGSPSTRIIGTPITAGTYDFAIGVEDTSGGVASQAYTLEVMSVGTLAIDTQLLPDARLGTPYSAELSASGGTASGFTWAVTGGELPPGLQLGASGTPSTSIVGTPTAFGTYAVEITVTDSDGAWGTRELTLYVQSDVLVITPSSIPSATLQSPYMTTLTASGGNGTAWTWTLRAGDALPRGLQFVDNGPAAIIAGTPTMPGAFTFTVELANDAGERDSMTYTLTVGAGLVIETTSLPPAREGVAYVAALTASGGTGSGYAWTLALGVLPSGLVLDASGTPSTRISGTTSALGTYPITVRVADDEGRTAEVALTLEVVAPFAITPTQILDATVCTAGGVTLTAVGGQGAHTWSVNGALPTGWQMRSSSAPTVEIVGRPTNVGNATFSLTVTDGGGLVTTQQYTVAVVDDPGVQRWAVLVGDPVVNDDTSVFLVDVCGETPGQMARISPNAPGTGDASTAADAVRFSPDGTAVAFVGDFTNDGNANLYVYDLTNLAASAVNVTNYSATGASVQDVYWAPNGDYLAFTADPNVAGHDQLFFVDLTNRELPGAPILISGGSAAASNAIDVMANDVFWSPGSDQLVYLGDLDTSGVNELYRTRVTTPASPTVGSKIHATLTGTQDCEDDVKWAPDGSGVLFRCDLDAADVDALWFARFVGAISTVSRVSSPGYGPDNDVGLGDYAFNRAGTRVFYLADEQHDGAQELFVAAYAGGAFATPSRAIAALPADRTITAAKWNPAGTRLAFRADLDVDERYELYVVDVSGALPAAPIRVSTMQPDGDLDVSTTEGYAFEWSPDGARIAYIADQTTEGVDQVYVARVTGAPPYVVERASPAATDPALDATNFHFSPDGRRLAMRGDFGVEADYELYVARVDGAGSPTPQRVSAPLPAGADVNVGDGAFAFRSDGLGLFFEADLRVNDDAEIWMVDLSGPQPTNPIAVGSTPVADGDYVFFRLNR